jgi:hypothetical protein
MADVAIGYWHFNGTSINLDFGMYQWFQIIATSTKPVQVHVDSEWNDPTSNISNVTFESLRNSIPSVVAIKSEIRLRFTSILVFRDWFGLNWLNPAFNVS